MKLLLLAAVAASALVTATASSAHQTADVRFATFNASLNRPAAGQFASTSRHPAVDDVFRRQTRNVAEVVQRVRPDVLLINEFDYDPAAARPVPRELPRGPPERRRADRLPVRVHRAVEHRHPVRAGPRQRRGIVTPRHAGYGDDSFGFGPSRASSGWSSTRSTRSRPGRADLPAVPLGRHARQPDPDAVLLARRGDDPAALVQEPLGRADPGRREDGPLPRLAPDAACLRRPRGPQRPAQLRRDPASGPTTSRRAGARYIYDDDGRRRRPQAGRALRDRRAPERDPLDGDSIPGAPSSCSSIRSSTPKRAPASAGAVEAAALQGGANLHASQRPAVRHGRLRRRRAREPARRLRPAARRTWRSSAAGVFWPVDDPLSRLTGVFDPG